MSISINRVFLAGNLTRDPELRYAPSGSAVANFSLAINRTYKDASGEKKEEVSFVRVVVWGKMAEVCGEYLTKGRPVMVEGRLKSRTWEGTDGQKKSALDVIATSVQFLGSKEKKQDNSASKADDPGRFSDDEASSMGAIDLDQDMKDVPF